MLGGATELGLSKRLCPHCLEVEGMVRLQPADVFLEQDQVVQASHQVSNVRNAVFRFPRDLGNPIKDAGAVVHSLEVHIVPIVVLQSQIVRPEPPRSPPDLAAQHALALCLQIFGRARPAPAFLFTEDLSWETAACAYPLETHARRLPPRRPRERVPGNEAPPFRAPRSVSPPSSNDSLDWTRLLGLPVCRARIGLTIRCPAAFSPHETARDRANTPHFAPKNVRRGGTWRRRRRFAPHAKGARAAPSLTLAGRGKSAANRPEPGGPRAFYRHCPPKRRSPALPTQGRTTYHDAAIVRPGQSWPERWAIATLTPDHPGHEGTRG